MISRPWKSSDELISSTFKYFKDLYQQTLVNVSYPFWNFEKYNRMSDSYATKRKILIKYATYTIWTVEKMHTIYITMLSSIPLFIKVNSLYDSLMACLH